MKITCNHQEDFEWAAAHRNMSLFSTRPSLHVLHAVLPPVDGHKAVCGAFNTRTKRGVIFDNHPDYLKWVHEDDAAELAVLIAEDGKRVFCVVVEE